MPITEIITPSLKQDAETRSSWETTMQPLLLKLVGSVPGVKEHFIAPLLTEDGINVESAVKYGLGLEWETAQNFYDFFNSDEFKAFGGQVKALATRPPEPQIYETDLSPAVAFSCPLTEVFRIHVGSNRESLEMIQEAWRGLIAAIKTNFPDVTSLSGTSLNLKESLFLGVIGWRADQNREDALKEPAVVKSLAALRSLDGGGSFTVKFVAY